SRRRHTRFSRDWSSDVCSSDLFCKDFLPKKYHYTTEYNVHDLNGLILQCKAFAESGGLDITLFEALDSHRKFVLNPTSHDSYDRSEERRVGREVRTGWSTWKKI